MIRFKSTLAILLLMQIGQFFTVQAQVTYTDTLGLNDYQLGTETLYQSPNRGYVFGNNGYGDKVKVRTFENDFCGLIGKVMFKFGAKAVNTTSPDSSRLIVRLYTLGGGLGTTTIGLDTLNGPGDELEDVTGNTFTTFIYMDDIDTSGGYTVVDVPMNSNLDTCYSRFAVGLDLTELHPTDTIGLFSTMDGDAGLSETCWDLTANDSWVTVLDDVLGWDLDVDPAIFPVFIFDADSTLRVSESQGVNLKVYPNPTNNVLHIANAIQGDLSVIDMSGRILQESSLERFSGGEVLIDFTNYTEGIYLVKIVGEEQVLTTTVKVVH